MSYHNFFCPALGLTLMSLTAGPLGAAERSNTELHLQYGELDRPTFAGGGDTEHRIYTLQHASDWKYGDTFLFLDTIDAANPGGASIDMYGEWYTNFSIEKMTGKQIEFNIVRDIGLIAGYNWSADAKVKKYLPGIRLALDIPGFAFANFDVTAYLDDSEGVSSRGAPREDDSFMIDFNWARPFNIGNSKFSIEGHVEYIGERTDEFGRIVNAWVLAQPQIRWNASERISLGIEYQYWRNKLGDADTDESALQLLLVWKF